MMAAHVDRKELIIDKALAIFAEKGYYKATTAMVAAAAGVTQPYVYHFFKNKEEIFKAVIDEAVNKIYESFAQSGATSDRLMKKTMGEGFVQNMETHRDEMVLFMQAHTITEPAIRDHIRERTRMIYDAIYVRFEKAGAQNVHETASKFMAMGYLITVADVLDIPEMVWFNQAEQ